jgi:hypothetical protein
MAESEVEEQNEEQPEEFMNRAARRAAKGKKGGQTDAGFAQGGGEPHGRGTVAIKRQQFGNRRTG